MSKVKIAVAFTLGAAVGAFTAWKLTKDIYARRAQEEIDSVKEVFSKLRRDDDNGDICIEYDGLDGTKIVYQKGCCDRKVETVDPEFQEYADTLTNSGYVEDVEIHEIHRIGTDGSEPYVIDQEAWGEFSDYTLCELYYYADRVLADDNDEVVDDIDATVGRDALRMFGEQHVESVFVRNDRLMIDYQIILMGSSYEDLLEEKPYKAVF